MKMAGISKERDRVVVRIDYLINQLHSAAQSHPQISRVDEQLRLVNEKDYEPEIVSIGPIHRGKNRLRNMEHHKVRYLQKLLHRMETLSIVECVKKLREIEDQARQCYPQDFHLDGDDFVEMLLLDGFFVIELLRKYWFEDLMEKNDPLFKSDHTLSRIRRDLMLLENQLPFFVLNHLFDMTKTNDPEENLQYLVLAFIVDMLPWNDVLKIYPKFDLLTNTDHLLGLIYQSYFSLSRISANNFFGNNRRKENDFLLHMESASELRRAGVRLKGSKGINLLGATFLDGVLKLPTIRVSDHTECLLRNLIAYELHLSNEHPKYVTDYAFLMNCLVNSSKDIAMLRSHGIISNFLGGDDMICHMFNRLGSNVVVRSSSFCYSFLFERVSKYLGLQNKTWMAKLRSNYFNTPWSMVSFLGGTMLLFFTILQSVFAVLSYNGK